MTLQTGLTDDQLADYILLFQQLSKELSDTLSIGQNLTEDARIEKFFDSRDPSLHSK